MNNCDEELYEIYERYRLEEYRYEDDQIFPIYIIILLGIISAIRSLILWMAIIFVIAFLSIAIYKALKPKNFSVQQPIILTKEEAKNGTELNVTINNIEIPLKLNVKIPPKTRKGQKFILRNVKTKKTSGKIVKINIYFTTEIN